MMADKPKPASVLDETLGESPMETINQEEKGKKKHFGMRPAASYDVKPKATGSNLKQFEKFLVMLKIEEIPSLIRGVPNETKLVSARVMDKVGGIKKLEPHLVYGSKKQREYGMMGMNEQCVWENKVPIQLWFPVNAVKENQSIKATSELILVKDGNGAHMEKFYFFEYSGSESLKEQIEEKKKEYGYTIQ
jgi:hypothetical protein